MSQKAKVVELTKLDVQPESDRGTIGIVTAVAPDDVVRLAHKSNFSHVVQTDGPSFDRELKTAQAMTEDLTSFVNDPVSVIFGAAKETFKNIHISRPVADKKTAALFEFEKFLKTVKGARRIREQAFLIADELYTNAMKTGHPHHKMSHAKFAREGTVELFAACDESRLLIGCRDSFGELGFSQVLTRITQCFDNGVVQSINHGQGGAGIGSFMVFNSCISYYCGVEKGRFTVVCVTLPLGMSDAELASLPKNIHLVAA